MKYHLFGFAAFLSLSISAQRPELSQRNFSSPAVEKCIETISARITQPKVREMFAQCFPNTLDTTVRYGKTSDGDDDTFVITGDIPAMWLRDSSAQVWPYLRFVSKDPKLARLIRGVLRRQFRSLLIDPYANAFMESPDSMSSNWTGDITEMKKGVFERKYELDSPCYPIRLAYGYWKATGDKTVFDKLWVDCIREVLTTLRAQQRMDGTSPYLFMRRTHAMHDTQSNSGYGHPGKPCGLIASSFRPSDDSTVFPYNIPGNFFAVSCLRKAATILRDVNKEWALADSCQALAEQVQAALKQYAVVKTTDFGEVYAFEVDGFGSHLLMDDANIPSLLSLPYIADVPVDDPIYQNTRRFVWSKSNPYFFSGKAGEGIGGPHEGIGYIWPMSDIMLAMTSTDSTEIKAALQRLITTDAGTNFIHEAYRQEDASKFTRTWFAWANTLFGELVLHLIDNNQLELLNSLK